MTALPSPRRTRGGKTSVDTRAPLAWPIRLRACPRRLLTSQPPIMIMQLRPERSFSTTSSIRAAATLCGGSTLTLPSAPLGLSPQETSAGSIRVATRLCPAWRTASAASRAISSGDADVCTQWDTGPTIPSMSDVSGALYFTW